ARLLQPAAWSSLDLSWYQFSVFHMWWDIFRSGRCPGMLRQIEGTSRQQDKRDGGQADQNAQRPGFRVEHACAGGEQKGRIEHERRQRKDDVDNDAPDHS